MKAVIYFTEVAQQYEHKNMEHMIGDARAKGRKGLILTCKDRLIHYYEKFGYKNMGVSASVHGGAVWYDMLLEFGDQKS